MPEDTGSQVRNRELGGAWLRARRAHALLSQEELGLRAGVDARTIRDIETGRTSKPRPSTVRLLVDALAAAEQDRAGSPDRQEVSVPWSEKPRPRELPADTFGFVGRAEQLAQLDRYLELASQQPTAVLISAVSGTAGVGKTALAVHWAHHVVDRFPDGQLYVNLRGYDPDKPVRPTDALAAFLRSLVSPVQTSPRRKPSEQRATAPWWLVDAC